MTAATRERLAIAPVPGDESVRKIVRAGTFPGDPAVAFVLAEYAGPFAAAPNLMDACRTALRAIEAAFPAVIPDEFADAYNRLHDALKDATKGEMRL